MRKGGPQVAPSLRTVEERQGATRLIISEMAARHGAAVIDPLPSLCGSERCMIQDRGVLLYADEDHLSVAGALRLAPLFRPWMVAPAQ